MLKIRSTAFLEEGLSVAIKTKLPRRRVLPRILSHNFLEEAVVLFLSI